MFFVAVGFFLLVFYCFCLLLSCLRSLWSLLIKKDTNKSAHTVQIVLKDYTPSSAKSSDESVVLASYTFTSYYFEIQFA